MGDVIFDSNNGKVLEPDLHDAALVGIFLRGTAVTLEFTQEDSTKFSLALSGLRGINIDSFWEQNIVRHICILRVKSADRKEVTLAIHGEFLNPLTGQDLIAGQNESLLFVKIYPSIGAEMVAICEKIDYERKEIG